jgi:hypothetical protein
MIGCLAFLRGDSLLKDGLLWRSFGVHGAAMLAA